MVEFYNSLAGQRGTGDVLSASDERAVYYLGAPPSKGK
jgi:hypothetical protein